MLGISDRLPYRPRECIYIHCLIYWKISGLLGAMSLSVLTDEQIRLLLESLTADELESFILNLKGALHDYSNGSQVPGESDIHQPHRQTVNSSRTGATTLFMPSSSPAGVGVKGVCRLVRPPSPALDLNLDLDLAPCPGPQTRPPLLIRRDSHHPLTAPVKTG